MNAILNQFFDRIQNAQRARSKDIRLTIEEANQISLEITKLTARDSDLINQIQNLLKSQPGRTEAEYDESVIFSGGKFTDNEQD